MPSPEATSAKHRAFVRPEFHWEAADCYLFDIDGTLLNSRDSVHYYAFRNAIHELCGLDVTIDGVPVHGNTDPGILRAVMQRAGMNVRDITAFLPQVIERMCAEVEHKREELAPELCASIPGLLRYLKQRGKLLGAASGNLEPIGWAKLEKAGVKPLFTFGAFSWPRENRADIFRYGVALAHERLGNHATVVVVGDTPSDIAAAHEIGIGVIALATGMFSFAELLACSPDACFDCAADMLQMSA
jgi:phosphoglycolate phosphatase-like HAD superfamily hydrolase